MKSLRQLSSLAASLAAITGLLLAAPTARAEARFSEGLKIETKISCGMTHLTEKQLEVLDALIQRDVTSARQGGVTGFAKTFTERRSEKEALNAGISTLTDAERAKLDALVAEAIAYRPSVVFYRDGPVKQSEGVAMSKAKPDIHGSVTLMYGQGSGGRSFYGTAAETHYTDPSGKMTIGVGVSDFHGKGRLWPYPYDYYDRGYAYPYEMGPFSDPY